MQPLEALEKNLKKIYPADVAERTCQQIKQKLADFDMQGVGTERYIFTEKDIILITYADQFGVEDEPALNGLQRFAGRHLKGIFNGIHILPFFPYSSDDGFSVMDYYQVNPPFGDWTHIQALSSDFRLMVDGVFNHISRKSKWFREFLAGQAPYDRYFISVKPGTDLSAVIRPRTSPLLTAVQTAAGERQVWTTFSDDQIDLNYANPQVLLEVIDVILFYIRKGASIIRIDAVPFLWKEIGTDCLHRPQTHALIKTLRALLDAAAPDVVLITESNVPFEDNISYLGSINQGDAFGDEAQLVYQFSLGPLVLHALISGNARVLSDWVASLPAPHRYFNFIASHDGIGLLPAQGILSEADIQALIQTTEAHGGMLSYKADTTGKRQVYELNITLYDFLNDPAAPQPEMDAARYLTSQAIMLELAGVPGVYVHSLFGSSNCMACYQDTQRPRSVNRRKFKLEQLEQDLAGDTRAGNIMQQYLELVSLRVAHSAFSPQAGQRMLAVDERVFALLRHNADSGERILCLSNLTTGALTLSLDFKRLELSVSQGLQDLITDKAYTLSGSTVTIEMGAYQSMWLLLEGGNY